MFKEIPVYMVPKEKGRPNIRVLPGAFHEFEKPEQIIHLGNVLQTVWEKPLIGTRFPEGAEL